MKLSAGNIDITPQSPVPLSGFAERSGVYSTVHDNLEINLIVLKDGTRVVLLYSFDTLFVPEEFVTLVLNKYGKEYGFKEEDIWMVASHTHFAPSLDKEKPGLGQVDDAYYKEVTEKLQTLTEQVLTAQPKDVIVKYGHTKSKLNVNRRKKLWRLKGLWPHKKVLLYPDYHGVKDDSVHLVELVNQDGGTEAVLWNYACHPVGFTHRTRVTAEYIGLLRGFMRDERNTSQLPVVFFQGFAGNIKADVTAVTHTRFKDEIGYFFQFRPKHTRFPSTEYYLEWVELLWQELKQALDSATESEIDILIASKADIPLGAVIGNYKNKMIHFRRLSMSDTIEFIGISGEVFAEYKDILPMFANVKHTVNTGYLAGTRIYLPTDKNVKEGGYEVNMFQKRFDIKGHFHEGLDDTIKNAISSL